MPSDLQHHDLLSRAMTDAPIGMCLIAPDGAFLAANNALSEFFGRTSDDLKSCTWQELTHPDDLAADVAHVQQLLDGAADAYRLTKRYLHSNGSVIVGDLSVSAIRDDSGAVDYFVSQIVDITARNRAETALAASQDRFRVMFQHTTDIITIMTPDGQVEWSSPSATALLGWEHDDSGDVDTSTFVHPDDLYNVQRAMERLFIDGQPIRSRHRLLRSDGTYRWFDAILTVEKDANDAPRRVYATSRDVHEEVLAQLALERSRALLRGVLDSLQDPWVLLNPIRDDQGEIVDFTYADANQAACEFNSRTREELLGSRLLDLLPDHATRGLLKLYAAVVETGVPLALDDDPFPDRRHPGRIGRYDNRAVRIGDQLSFTWRDVTERYEAQRQLSELAHHDDLTGLPNRARFNERMQAVFSRTPRTGSAIALLYCDLDDFKPINDEHGHAVGDIVLRELGKRVAASVRSQDTVARVGGDEFVAILEGVHTPDQAVQVAEKLRTAAAEPIVAGDVTVTTSMSVGVAIGEPADDPAELLHRADVALYRAKADGGNQTRLWQVGSAGSS